MFDRLGHVTFRHRRAVLALAGVFLAVGASWGTGVFGSMISSGFDTPGSESARALARTEASVGRGGADVVVLYRDRSAGAGRWSTTRRSGTRSSSTWPGCRATWSRRRRRTGRQARRPRGSSPPTAGRRTPWCSSAGTTRTRAWTPTTELEPALRDAPSGLDVRLGGDEAISQRHHVPGERGHRPGRADLAAGRAGAARRHLRRPHRRRPAPRHRRPRDPRRVHDAARAQSDDRRLHLRRQHRDDARARPGHRLRAVRRQPVPRGDPVREGHRAGAARDDVHRRTHRRVLRPDGRDLARVAAASSRRCSSGRWASAGWPPCSSRWWAR